MSTSSALKIVYMGTPDFAVAPLKALVENGYDVKLVVAQPDKPNGRGKKLRPGAVKKAAEEAGLEIAQPAKIRGNSEFLDQIKNIAPDIIIVAAYGKILPPELLEIPPLGCVNIHGSLLPKYRGAAPVQRCIMEGDETTGVTIMQMAEGMDTGDIIAVASEETAGKNSGELLDELSVLGAELMISVLPSIADGTAERVPQNDEEATYASMLEKSEGMLDFSSSAAALERKIRGFAPNPGAFTELEGERMKVWRAEVEEYRGSEQPGTVIEAGKDGIKAVCGEGLLVITEIQMPGKRAMNVSDYLRGHSIEAGIILGRKNG